MKPRSARRGALGSTQTVTLVFKAKIAASARPGSQLTAAASAGLDALNGPDPNLANNLHKVKVRVI